MKTNNNYKVAVVGCGRIAGHHCRSIDSVKGMEMVAVCDLDEDKALEYGETFKIKHFTDYRLMLNNVPEIDIVVVATPSGMHFEHSIEFMQKYKKHVIIEKPTFMRPNELETAYNIAQKNLNIFPVFQNRYNKAVDRVKKAIVSNELGKLGL